MRPALAARGVGVAARVVEPLWHGAILARYTRRTASGTSLVPRSGGLGTLVQALQLVSCPDAPPTTRSGWGDLHLVGGASASGHETIMQLERK